MSQVVVLRDNKRERGRSETVYTRRLPDKKGNPGAAQYPAPSQMTLPDQAQHSQDKLATGQAPSLQFLQCPATRPHRMGMNGRSSETLDTLQPLWESLLKPTDSPGKNRKDFAFLFG